MNAQQPIARAWSWSVIHSPILNTWRWLNHQYFRQAPAASIIKEADLPDSIAKQINTTTRKTRLWPSERADIARELCAHAQDALAEGRSPQDTLGTLGDPRQVAKLLRRSAKRKRHWIWRLRQRTLQAAGMLLLLAAVVYVVLFIRFNTASPSVKRDFLAELNVRNNAFPEDQKAYTAYRDLWLAWNPLRGQLSELDDPTYEDLMSIDPPEPPRSAIDRFPRYAPDAPFHAELSASLEEIRPLIDQAREATALPTLGTYYSTKSEPVLINGEYAYSQPIPPEPDPADRQELVAVLMPDLAYARVAATHFTHDAYLAATQSDNTRVLDNLRATFGIARQVSDENFLITAMVAIAIQSLAEDATRRIIHNHPDLFSQAQLTELAHLIASNAPKTRRMNMDSERMMFDDVLQRTYSDDGSHPTHPDGRLTPEGMVLIASVSNLYSPQQDGPGAASRLVGPIASTVTASRRETQMLADMAYNSVNALIARGPQGLPEFQELGYPKLLAEIEQSPNLRHPLLRVLLPALGRAATNVFEAEAGTNATLTAIAANIYRKQHGQWPSNLSVLTPQLLPGIPQDPFDPGAPIKSLVRDGQLFLYYNGADGDDDNATAKDTDPQHPSVRSLTRRFKANWPENTRLISNFNQRRKDQLPPDADWILYPPTD